MATVPIKKWWKLRSSHAPLGFVPFEGSKYFIPAIMGNCRRTWYFAGMAVPHYKKRQIESEPRHVEFTPTQAKENSGCPTTNL